MEEFEPRPLSVTILSVFVLSITSWHGLRVYSALLNWAMLKEFGAPAGYLLLTGLVWAIAGSWLAFSLWSGQRRAFAAGLTLTGLYFGWYWLDRLVIQAEPAPNGLFSAAASLALLMYACLCLVAARDFFDKEQG